MTISYSPNNKVVRNFYLFSKTIAFILAGVGVLSLLGWIFSVPYFPIVHIGYLTIKVNSAFLAIAGASAIYTLPTYRVNKQHFRVFILALSVIFTICILTILQYQLSINLGIDELLFSDIGKPTLGKYPGRVAPSAAIVSLIFIGCVGLFHLGYFYTVQTIFIFVCLIAYSRVFADLLGLDFINTGSFYSNMEINTASNVLLACLAIIASFPKEGYCRVLTSKYSGSSISRRAVLLTFFVSAILVWLRVQAVRMHILASEETIVLSVTAFTVLILVVFYIYGTWMNQADIQRDEKSKILLENEAKFKAIIENTDAVIWSIDTDCKYINFNQAFVNWASRWDFAITVGTVAAAISDEKQQGYWRKVYDQVLQGESLDFEYLRPHKDGDVYMRFLLKPIYLEDKIIGVTGIGIDITEGRVQRLEIEQNQAQMHALLENTDAIIWAVDTECRYTTFNAAFVEWVNKRGFNVNLGDRVNTLSAAKNNYDWTDYYDRVLKNGESLDFEYTREVNGVDIYMRFLLKPIYVKDKIIGATGLGVDVSERNKQRKALEANEAKLKALVEHTNAFVWAIDKDYRYIAFNSKFKQIDILFGKDVQIGDIAFEGLEESDFVNKWKAVYAQVLAGKSLDFEFNQEMFGQRYAVKFLVNPVYLNEEIIGLTAVGIDILKEKLLQEELTLAKEKAEDASHIKSRFLSVMSHEIRTPLNAVIGMTNLLIRDKPSPSQIEKLNAMQFSGKHLLNLVNDILDFNKIEAGKVTLEQIPMSYHQLAGAVINSFQYAAAERGLYLQLDVDDTVPPTLLGDPTHMQQILTNLIGNAIKFTHEGGVILSIKSVPVDSQTVNLHIAVVDTGIGIAASNLENIFDRFTQADDDTTRKYGGTGLGLPIAKQLLQLMGADLNVESTEGKGTRFFFNIVADIAHDKLAITATESAAFEVVEDLKGTRVLIVDDNAINRLVAEEFLSGWNAVTDSAENGLEAVAKIQADDFDIVLMDLQMPLMDGYEASKIIRGLADEKKKNIPIIAITASSLAEVQGKIKAHGMNDYVSKPFDPISLFKKIALQLDIEVNKVQRTENEVADAVENTPDSKLINLMPLMAVAKGKPTIVAEFITKIESSINDFSIEYEKHIHQHSLVDMRKLIHAHRPTFELLEANKFLYFLEETKIYLDAEPRDENRKNVFLDQVKQMLASIKQELNQPV